MKPQRTPSLEDRIKEIRDEIDVIIASRVDTIAKQSPGVPAGVIRNLVIARAPGCSCAQYLELSRDGRAEAPKP
jgi:hypothetical protein